MIKVLALCSYPVEAAASRYRAFQYVSRLGEQGVSVTVSPFLTSTAFNSLYSGSGGFVGVGGLITGISRRISNLLSVSKYDVLFVQREAMFFGPEVFEFALARAGRLPLVLDLDDATYLQYVSPRFGKLGSALKFFGKTDRLIDRAEVVICGNRFIAEYVEARGTKAVVIPTVVDTDVFTPIEREQGVPVIGWIGTHSTFPSLRSIFPVLENLATKHEFVLKIVGSGRERVEIPGVKIENLVWNLEREVEDFQGLDIGLYPITTSGSANEDWIKSKSGFKAIQYMAVGVPFVMSPVGVAAEMGVPGETHFNAESDEDWYTFLDKLLSEATLRAKMGEAGRHFSVENYGLARQAKTLTSALLEAAEAHEEKHHPTK